MTGVRIALATLTAAVIAAPAAAQGTCQIDLRDPFPLQSALIYIGKHDAQADTAERAKLLKQAVKSLTDMPSGRKNEAGRNFLLGGVYVRWFLDQGAAPVLRAKRGELGFVDNPDGEFFLPTALNEAMGALEKEKPACADSTLRYRNGIASKVLNMSISYYNAKQYDPAIEYAGYALQISPRSPQVGTAYQVLANAAQAKGDLAGAIKGYEQLIASMGTDPASAAARATATFNMAVLTRDQAAALDAAARTAGLRRAADLFKAAADLAPDGPNAATARTAAARALQQSGDSASVSDIYADMLANPTKYTSIQLFEAGVVSATAHKLDDAAAFYQAGLRMNPHYRDALFNAANIYFELHQPDKMAPLVLRLRSADPMNPDVLKLAGAVWQERARLAADANAKKAAQDSTAAYLAAAAKLPARVLVTQFKASPDGTVILAGSVENLTASAANYTIMFDLLDKTGASVGGVTVDAPAVPGKSKKEFSVKAQGATPVAWRYIMR